MSFLLNFKEKTIEKIKLNHDERVREIETSIYSIHCKLTEEFQSKLDKLNGSAEN